MYFKLINLFSNYIMLKKGGVLWKLEKKPFHFIGKVSIVRSASCSACRIKPGLRKFSQKPLRRVSAVESDAAKYAERYPVQ